MKPDRYEVSSQGRHRLSGMIQKRGSKMGLSNLGGFLFGVPFVGVGVFVAGMGTKVFKVDPSTIHAPYWVLTIAGLCFAFGGFAVWGMAFKQLQGNRKRLQIIGQYAGNPALANALADYRWHREGFEASEWSAVAKSIITALGISLFLSIFNWWAFGTLAPLPLKIFVGLFDCFALWAWIYAFMRVGRALKFGRSRITYTTFPYQIPGPVIIRWQTDSGLSQIRKGTFTLRCVEEWMERRGKNENATLVHEEIWSAAWSFEKPRNLPLKESVELAYELPADAVSTHINADKPVFWELAVKLDLPGLDFKETYLVPIYGAKVQTPAMTAQKG